MTHQNIPDYLQKDLQAGMPEGSFIDHMLAKADICIAKDMRVLILTMTKKSSEEITNFMLSKGYKTFYLHSEISTTDRWKIIQKLKS
jgi:excinuclease ABC subunit B